MICPQCRLRTRLRFKRCTPRLWKMPRVSRLKFVDWRSPARHNITTKIPNCQAKITELLTEN
ncbi:MAG: hypothetical protein EAZ60_24955 [Oscillatoriales cyanobacterium]|uniref:hypothetical protein n=1 Tax=unclassified Microcoleus TaxID=2642155 RepID=UPI001D69B869|nr:MULTISPECIES: hypothetical protein [unclassified Microcoleus]MCC3526661.1 hypothetical protein [Microcoleus sp. PH2017_21_RUC_O_A]TAF51973.1 MAG: hypothetical protein EAZ60_24955 [Oscillatoriales cyanobacterium]